MPQAVVAYQTPKTLQTPTPSAHPHLTLLTDQTPPKRNQHRIGVKQEVYPFKSRAEVYAMQDYFLARYHKAYAPSKKYSALRDFVFFAVGINIGLRASDLLKLKWGNIITPDGSFRDDPYNYIQEDKTEKFRYLVLNDDVKKVLSFYLKQLDSLNIPHGPNDLIFDSLYTKEVINPRSMTRILKKAAEAVGITYNVGTHSLRKTFGYNYFQATHDIITLQKVFNHSTPATTLRYIGIMDEEITNAYAQVTGFLTDFDEEE